MNDARLFSFFSCKTDTPPRAKQHCRSSPVRRSDTPSRDGSILNVGAKFQPAEMIENIFTDDRRNFSELHGELP